MIGPIGLVGKGFVKLFSTFKGWWIVITLIILASTMIGSINEGIEQKNWKIPIKDLGLFLVSADEQLYEEVQELEKENLEVKMQDGGWKFIKEISRFSWHILKNLFTSLWMIFFNFILFYKFLLYILGDSSRKLRATMLSILAMVFLQIFVLGIPFRGLFSLGKFIIGVVGGI